MSGDSRIWARLTVDFADSPKVAGLSDAAFRALVEMILWARRGETDGVLPARVVHRRWGRPETQSVTESETHSVTDSGSDPVGELLTNHPERPSLSRNGHGDYVLRDFLEHQESRADVEARKARNRANGRRGGRPRKASSTPPETHSVTESETHSVTDSGTQKKAETETEKEQELLRSSCGGSGGSSDVAATPPVAAPSSPRGADPTTTTAPKRKPAASRGTRITEDWKPSPQLVEWTRANCPDINPDEVDRFRDYWISRTGAAATKRDWNATWRNWARRAQDDVRARQARVGYRNQNQIIADERRRAAAATAAMQAAGWPAMQPPATGPQPLEIPGNPLKLIEGEAS